MPMVADGRVVGVKNRENLPTSEMDGPFPNNLAQLYVDAMVCLVCIVICRQLTTVTNVPF